MRHEDGCSLFGLLAAKVTEVGVGSHAEIGLADDHQGAADIPAADGVDNLPIGLHEPQMGGDKRIQLRGLGSVGRVHAELSEGQIDLGIRAVEARHVRLVPGSEVTDDGHPFIV